MTQHYNWREEVERKKELMRELLDDHRTGLKPSSDTNKTRMELVGMLDECAAIIERAVQVERERIGHYLIYNLTE